MTDPLFPRREVWPASVAVRNDPGHPAHRPALTRRMHAVLRLLEQGYVAELRKPGTRGRPSNQYLLRSPEAHEADGGLVLRKVVDALIARGDAVRLTLPALDRVWVLATSYYAPREAAFTVLSQPAT